MNNLHILIVLFLISGCDYVFPECPGENCSGHGECYETKSGDKYCNCDQGYTRGDNYSCVDSQQSFKPVIYLYPTETTDVHVKFARDVDFTYTYPQYPNDGWVVTAHPDGTLCEVSGDRCWYSLFWEGFTHDSIDYSSGGFCVAGEDTLTFLEEMLPRLGLDWKEANEFIIYWLPKLASNPYNIISFAQKSWIDAVPLIVDPFPDSQVRFLMIYRPVSAPETVVPQTIVTPVRTGFTLVEWGGRQQDK
ncbi:hypothetical protein KKF34_05460 [Myxococcota bacterium]|nr:hypothetical protein [Myxococcota bacterium]MBU1379611.1 hypothetical protein [Myxococcota bacterium]MBU1496308.1 hypothetical protein [Myxococcota bacterium]